jgi:hypothetical protein
MHSCITLTLGSCAMYDVYVVARAPASESGSLAAPRHRAHTGGSCVTHLWPEFECMAAGQGVLATRALAAASQHVSQFCSAAGGTPLCPPLQLAPADFVIAAVGTHCDVPHRFS